MGYNPDDINITLDKKSLLISYEKNSNKPSYKNEKKVIFSFVGDT